MSQHWKKWTESINLIKKNWLKLYLNMNTELKENTRKNNFEMIFQVDG